MVGIGFPHGDIIKWLTTPMCVPHERKLTRDNGGKLIHNWRRYSQPAAEGGRHYYYRCARCGALPPKPALN